MLASSSIGALPIFRRIMETEVEFILYVKDQQGSRDFYSKLLQKEPRLDVPGMTEFILRENVILGLMPENGISRILKGMPHPSEGNGVPRCELYLYTDDLKRSESHAISCGGKLISEAQPRNWGHEVAYIADPDGHILAFAKVLSK